MKVFAYCADTFKKSVRKAAGVDPATCPPVDAETFDPAWLEGNDLIYFDFHGLPGAAYWFEEIYQSGMIMAERVMALTADQIRTVDLGGAVVFALSCYLGDEDSPMLNALLSAGASYVVGGDGKNWAATKRVTGANRLGRHFRKALERGNPPLQALSLAKKLLQLTLKPNSKTVQDTLAFRAYYRPEESHDHAKTT